MSISKYPKTVRVSTNGHKLLMAIADAESLDAAEVVETLVRSYLAIRYPAEYRIMQEYEKV